MNKSVLLVGLAVASSMAMAGTYNDHAAYLADTFNNTVITFFINNTRNCNVVISFFPTRVLSLS